jgi:hypothetical protein
MVEIYDDVDEAAEPVTIIQTANPTPSIGFAWDEED